MSTLLRLWILVLLLAADLMSATGAAAATATTTTLASATNPVVVGGSTLLTATVAPAAATGTVTFKDGAVTLGSAALAAGVATLNARLDFSGSRSLTAVYAGNASYTTSTSAALAQTVDPIVGPLWGQIAAQGASFTVPVAQVVRYGAEPSWVQRYVAGAASCSTTFFGSDPAPGVTKRCDVIATTASAVAFSSSVNPVAVGSNTVLTATVTPVGATGTVTFKDGSTALATVNLAAGSATLSRSFTTAGAHALSAVYNGTPSYASSTAALGQSVVPRTTSITLASSVNPSTPAQATALTARVSPTTTTGTATFFDGATPLAAVALVGGTATLTQSFAAGAHLLSVRYSGDANHQPSSSANLTQSVNTPVPFPAPPASPVPVAQFEYDAVGQPTRAIQAPGVPGLGLASRTTWDRLGRPDSSTDPANATVRLAYDGLDRATQVTDPRNLVTATPRNGLGDVTQLASPDTGTASHGFDAAGRLLTRTDSRGVQATHAYDALGRLTGTSFTKTGQPAMALAWTYDQTGPGFSNGIGRLTSTTFPGGSSQYAYDPQGRQTSAVQRIAAAAGANSVQLTHTVAYGYDLAGHVNQITYPSGRVLRIAYANGLPSAVTLAPDAIALPATVIDQIVHSPFGPVQSWRLPLATGADIHSREFDGSGRLVRQTLGRYLRDLGYDAADRIVRYTHYDRSTGTATSAANALNQTFGYDAAGRLTGVGMGTSNWTIGYDASGNRTGVTLNGIARAYTTEATSNRLASVANPLRSFGYDSAGNTLSDSAGTSAVYNLAGRLASLTKGTLTASYLHDAHGLRLRKHTSAGGSSTVVFVYDQAGHLLGEYGPTGAALREYVWLGDTPIAMFTPGSVATSPPLLYWIHVDHLDTPRVVVDANNAVRWRWMAEPFGTTAPETNPQGLGALVLNLRFPGQYADAESGLSYNTFRDYDPTVGRYVQSDPIGLAGGINTYSYSENNPVSFSDPRGLATWKGWAKSISLGPYQREEYELNSDCLCGAKWKIKVTVNYGGPGKGPGIAQKWFATLVDPLACPSPSALSGPANSFGAGIAARWGLSYSRTRIGLAESVGIDIIQGLGLAVGIGVGRSSVEVLERTPCDDCPPK